MHFCTGVLKSDEDTTETDVAVKAPKVSMIHAASLNDFYQEANTAISFDHPNVLKCLGMSDGPKELPFLLFEFMHFGDLATILAQNRNKLSNGNIAGKDPILTQVNAYKLFRFIAHWKGVFCN